MQGLTYYKKPGTGYRIKVYDTGLLYSDRELKKLKKTMKYFDSEILKEINHLGYATANTIYRYNTMQKGKEQNITKALMRLYRLCLIEKYTVKEERHVLCLYTLSENGARFFEKDFKAHPLQRALRRASASQAAVAFSECGDIIETRKRNGPFLCDAKVTRKNEANIYIISCTEDSSEDAITKKLESYEKRRSKKEKDVLILVCPTIECIKRIYLSLKENVEMEQVFFTTDSATNDEMAKEWIYKCSIKNGRVEIENISMK